MPIRDILVSVDAVASLPARLELTLNLAQAHRAHLTGVYPLPASRDSVDPPVGVGLPPTVLSPTSPEGASAIGLQRTSAAPEAPALRDTEHAETAERSFRDWLSDRGLDGEWHMLSPSDTRELIGLAKTSDLAILGQGQRGGDPHVANWIRPDDVALESGRPVLVVPYAGAFPTVGRRVIAAWDGTREAARALHDGLALLSDAATMTIIHVATRGPELDRDRLWLNRLVRHVGRHGIMANIEEIRGGDVGVADLLLSRATDLGVDMILAGGYHHAQLREVLLGGVSRDLLDRMTVPILMSH